MALHVNSLNTYDMTKQFVVNEKACIYANFFKSFYAHYAECLCVYASFI